MIKIFVSFRLSKGFLAITQKAWSIADKIEKLDFINIKNLWGKRVQDGEHMYTCGGFILIFGKSNTVM